MTPVRIELHRLFLHHTTYILSRPPENRRSLHKKGKNTRFVKIRNYMTSSSTLPLIAADLSTTGARRLTEVHQNTLTLNGIRSDPRRQIWSSPWTIPLNERNARRHRTRVTRGIFLILFKFFFWIKITSELRYWPITKKNLRAKIKKNGPKRFQAKTPEKKARKAKEKHKSLWRNNHVYNERTF